jgi:hypothetical protein
MIRTGPDDDELSDDDAPTLKKVHEFEPIYHCNNNQSWKQAKLDTQLETLAAELADKYSPGICPIHPDISCFHHRKTDFHFHLDQPAQYVWAHAIVSLFHCTLQMIKLTFFTTEKWKCDSGKTTTRLDFFQGPACIEEDHQGTSAYRDRCHFPSHTDNSYTCSHCPWACQRLLNAIHSWL